MNQLEDEQMRLYGIYIAMCILQIVRAEEQEKGLTGKNNGKKKKKTMRRNSEKKITKNKKIREKYAHTRIYTRVSAHRITSHKEKMNRTRYLQRELALERGTSRLRSRRPSPSTPNYVTPSCLMIDTRETYTTARRHGNLYCVPSYLTDILQIKRLVGRFVLPAIDDEGIRVDGDLHARRPIRVHLPVLVVETLELQLQIGSPHQRLMHRGLQLEHVIADGQIVL